MIEKHNKPAVVVAGPEDSALHVFRKAEIDAEVAIKILDLDFSVGTPEARLQNKLGSRESAAKRESISDATEEQQQSPFQSGCGGNTVVSSQMESWNRGAQMK